MNVLLGKGTSTLRLAMLAFSAAASVRAQELVSRPNVLPNVSQAAESADRGQGTAYATGLGIAEELGVPGGLRPEEVVRAALHSSPLARSRDAEIAELQAELDRIRLAFVPRLGVTAGYFRLSSIDAPSLGFLAAPADQTRAGVLAPDATLVSVGLQFPVLLDQTSVRVQLAIPVTDYFLRILPSVASVEHAHEAAQIAKEATDAETAVQAEVLYWTWVRAKLGLVLASQAVTRASAHRSDAESMFRAGVAVSADVARARAEESSARERVVSLQEMLRAIHDRIQTVMHVERVADEVGALLPTLETTHSDLENLLLQATAQRPELRALRAQLAALRAQRTVTLAGALPRIDVLGEVLLANPNPRFVPQQQRFDATWAVGAQIGWQVNDLLEFDARERTLEARIAAAENSAELLRDGIRAELVEAERQRRVAVAALRERTEQLTAADETLAQATSVFRAGQGTGLAVVDAQTLLTQSRNLVLDAHIDYAIALARMERAVGREHAVR